jgi:uncharacterized protein DUF3175
MASKKDTKRWSQEVTENTDALDLKKGVFKLKNPCCVDRLKPRRGDRGFARSRP